VGLVLGLVVVYSIGFVLVFWVLLWFGFSGVGGLYVMLGCTVVGGVVCMLLCGMGVCCFGSHVVGVGCELRSMALCGGWLVVCWVWLGEVLGVAGWSVGGLLLFVVWDCICWVGLFRFAMWWVWLCYFACVSLQCNVIL